MLVLPIIAVMLDTKKGIDSRDPGYKLAVLYSNVQICITESFTHDSDPPDSNLLMWYHTFSNVVDTSRRAQAQYTDSLHILPLPWGYLITEPGTKALLAKIIPSSKARISASIDA